MQLAFLAYLVVALILVFLNLPWIFLAVSLLYILYLRYLLVTYQEFILEYSAYKTFYFWLSIIAIFAYGGYFAVRKYAFSPYHFYLYILLVLAVVLSFRYYFKSRYGRDYTYGVVEEVKNDLVKVFVHDDIAANVKPGYYWVPAVPDAEPGLVVKLLVEERAFRSARPVRILEVYLESQSSQTETEPKEETE
ncbi:putative membrane protein [Thermococcus stetteri]|nr:putative membrane protein [Thermococcus stetteri]